jgi:hypothetical protein
VLEQTGYAEQTISVRNGSPKSISLLAGGRRRFSIQSRSQAAADQQDAWLNKASAENLTREEIRHQIKAATAIAAGTTIMPGSRLLPQRR